MTQSFISSLAPQEVRAADVIFMSHSGGKDSQAALALLMRMGFAHKIVLVHADLDEMEWEEMAPWINKNGYGLPLHVVQAEMDFFELCRSTGGIPSGNNQYCTDHLKTQPIKEFIHAYMYKHGLKTAINATGMRASESGRRAAKKPFTLSKGDNTSGMHMVKKHAEHTIWDYLPIFHYSDEEVFEEIANAGQEVHPVYKKGFSRLSCVMCVNGRINEHKRAAQERPELVAKFIALEKELGKSLRLKQRNKVKYKRYLDEYVFEPQKGKNMVVGE